jgi:hypothetical protein
MGNALKQKIILRGNLVSDVQLTAETITKKKITVRASSMPNVENFNIFSSANQNLEVKAIEQPTSIEGKIQNVVYLKNSEAATDFPELFARKVSTQVDSPINSDSYSENHMEFENKIKFYQEENLRLSSQLVQQRQSKEITSAKLQEVEEVKKMVALKLQEIETLLSSISNVSILNIGALKATTPQSVIIQSDHNKENISEDFQEKIIQKTAPKSIEDSMDAEIRNIFKRK